MIFKYHNLTYSGRISFYIQNQGEEATQLGSGLALQQQDHIFGQYRELGVLYCKGFSMDDALAQLFGYVHVDLALLVMSVREDKCQFPTVKDNLIYMPFALR